MANEQEVSILIVDDDMAIRNLLAGFLGDRWYCRTAGSVNDAIAILDRESFHLVVTDINMPGQSGLELCHLVRREYPAVEVIVISAFSDIEHAIQAMRCGASDYVTKPFSLDQVLVAIERALAKREAAVRNRQQIRALEARRDSVATGNSDDGLEMISDKLYASYRATIQGLARTLEARDFETRGHSDRVVAYSLRIGTALQLEQHDMTALEQGALLHDIGKIGVRDSVLLKRGALTDEEWLIMREHVGLGLKIISQIDFLAPARFVIGQHHEKYDGSGYPNGLRGDAIHIAARVFSVADAYDAITSDRPYRAARSYGEACREINKYAGSQFDPAVVNAFLAIPAAEWPEIRRKIELRTDKEPPASMSDIQSFIDSLGCPGTLSEKLDRLCA